MIETGEPAASAGNAGRGRGRKPSSPLDRVLRALNHPIRRRILRLLVDGKKSASVMSKELGLNLGLVSYHLNQVLAKECEVVELVETIPRRGAIEKVYKLKLQALTEGDRMEERADGGGPRIMSFEECFIVAVAAMDADAFEGLPGSAWEWFLARVDDEGWGQVREARADFAKRARAAVDGSQERAGAAAAHDIVIGTAIFPAVSTAPAAP